MRVRFIGEEGECEVFGLVFPKGELVDVSELPKGFQAKLANNPTFEATDPLDHDANGKKGGSAPSPEAGLAGLTVPKLRELAAERGVDLDGLTKKGDIIAALELAEEAAA
jgi:pyruvate/2-oxoglutarate dehydrogenase complex dihydrolipoamide acyltransferase (E2) component